MAIIIKLDEYELREAFRKMDRDYYSIEGYRAMIELFEECGGEDFELDVIALCCDFEEESEDYIRGYYNVPEDEDIMDYLNYRTYAVDLGNGNIFYQAF